METPDETRMMVFRRGMHMGLNGVIDRGGQVCPISMLGDTLLWKNAQKNEEKNRTSEVINRIIPVFSPFITSFEWFPWLEDSRKMSFHHIVAIVAVRMIEVIIGIPVFLFIMMMVDMVRHIALIEAMIGHGLSFTR
jgi:hypothetical protein